MRKRREERMLFSFMLVIILVLLTVIGAGIVFWIVFQGKSAYVGKWNAEIALDDEIKYAVDMWMHEEKDEEEILAVYETMDSPRLEPIIISLTMDKDGNFACELNDDSFEQCENGAYEYAVDTLTEIIARKLIASGYNGTDVKLDAREVIEESVEGDLEQYLRGVMPGLLPKKETIKELYTGAGSYIYDRKNQTVQFTDYLGKSITVDLVWNQNQMVFTQHEGENGSQHEERSNPIIWKRVQ